MIITPDYVSAACSTTSIDIINMIVKTKIIPMVMPAVPEFFTLTDRQYAFILPSRNYAHVLDDVIDKFVPEETGD